MGTNGYDDDAEKGISCHVISDGRIATLVWQIAPSDRHPEGHISISIPVSGLRQLRSAIHTAHVQHYGYGPLSVEIGHLEEMRNMVLMTIDKDTDAPLPFLLKDDLASKMAKWITEDQISRLNAVERSKLATAIVEPRRGIILPRKS